MPQVREFASDALPDRDMFEAEIRGAAPVVLRGLIRDWDIVGQNAPDVFARLKTLDSGAPQETLLGQPGVAGRFHYADSLRTQNYDRVAETLSQGLERLLAGEHVDGVYLQSIPLDRHMPDFVRAFPMPLVPDGVVPRAWIGTTTTVQTHFDPSENIAAVVLGEREVTLFPPEQLPNLYPGPIETAPGSAVVSLADIDNPDFDKHPRFKRALETKRVVHLKAGDAIYMPPGWWHRIRALSPLNMLVNAWWSPQPSRLELPFAAMSLAMLNFHDMDPAQRAVWARMFSHFVFLENGDPMAHVPDDVRGLLGGIAQENTGRAIYDTISALAPLIGMRMPTGKS